MKMQHCPTPFTIFFLWLKSVPEIILSICLHFYCSPRSQECKLAPSEQSLSDLLLYLAASNMIQAQEKVLNDHYWNKWT